jgi:hypothetical protein
VPAVTGASAKGAFLQRARFIAISEFGPFSLIYHEGRAYRVWKAKLPASQYTEEGGQLATSTIYVCDACGAAHQDDELERCHVCRASMAGVHPIRNILRIDNVETAPAERITANDEDRQRRGFDIQTVFAWPRREGALDVAEATVDDDGGTIVTLAYAPRATISRINKGLRRRKEKSIFGFGIDPATGRWTGSPDDDGDQDTEGPVKQRVVPIVQDNKNALLLRVAGEPPSETGMTTLQHALARGIETVFQLEEGETLTEAVPSREDRRAILAYEATEGGAGVLGRLASEPTAVSKIARQALVLIHLREIDAAITAADPAVLVEEENAKCVKGCYRCLLSYRNQPDHELIDRTDPDALGLLLRLARSRVNLAQSDEASDSDWQAAIARWRLPAPDPEPLTLNGTVFPLAWRDHLVAAALGSLETGTQTVAEERGYSVMLLPEVPGDQPPPELVRLLGTV